jgi:hypothetical protein
MKELKICKHSNGRGWCSVYKSYCVEGPCEKEEMVEYATVIRCKDCIYASFYPQKLMYECGRYADVLMFPDDFCGYGKRREENNV